MTWTYGMIKKTNGRYQISEIFLNHNGDIIAAVAVNMPISNQVFDNPEKVSFDVVKDNFFEEVALNQFTKVNA